MNSIRCAAYLAILLLTGCRDWNNPVTHNGKQQTHMPTRGLVAHYPFSGNANDSSGNGFNGTVYGATLVVDRFGNKNCAYQLDGVDDYIDIGNPAGDNPPELTQCAWIKSSAVPANDLVIFTKRHEARIGSDWPTLSMEKNGSAACALDDDNYYNHASSSIKINDNAWHFLCGIRDHTVYQIYVDGVLEKELIDGHAMGGSAANLHVGHHGAWNRYFSGLIDDVRIYTRALSKLEIDTLYHESGYTPPLDTPSLSAYGISETSIKIQWRNIPKASTYSLEHSSSVSGVFAELYSGSDTMFTHTGLTKNQIVWYRLKARNEFSSSEWSDIVSAVAQTNFSNIWMMANQYSSVTNPNGVWSYGRKWSPDGNTFNLFPARWGSTGWYLGGSQWNPSLQSGVNLWANDNSNGLPCVRWICINNGIYTSTTTFKGADNRGVNVIVYVVVNNQMIFSDTLVNLETRELSSGALNLTKGSTIDFLVKWNGVTLAEYNWTLVDASIYQMAE